MNPFFFLFFSYVLSWSGFLLGKSTIEEQNEVKKFARGFAFILILLFYVFLLYGFYGFSEFYLFVLMCFVFVFGWFEFNLIEHFHNVVLLALSFVFLNDFGLSLYPILGLVFSMTLINSFKKFNLKEEVYSLILLCIVYFACSLF